MDKLNINWFPGHMAKALRSMAEEVKNVDMILYVLDSRAPISSVNPEFVGIIGDKPILYILNKADMVREEDVAKFKNYFKKPNTDVIALNSTLSGAIKKIEPIMTRLCDAKIQKYKAKGFSVHLRAMVLGVPNSGKSTLINNLCGYKKTITGDRAGVTRGKQWLALKNGFELLDTPGTLYPNIKNQEIALNLAFIGSVKNEVLDMGELAVKFIEYCQKHNKQAFSYYKIKDVELSPLEILEQIATVKHYLSKGAEIDYERTAFAIIDDFRKGKLGKITLDTL